MFNKLKQFKDLRDQAKTLQSVLAEEITEVEEKGIKIKINGNLEVLEIKIEEGMANDKVADNMKAAVNEAIKKTQKVMAKKMQEMGGFPGLN